MSDPTPREVDQLLTQLVAARDQARHNNQAERAQLCQRLAEAAAQRVPGRVVLDGEEVEGA